MQQSYLFHENPHSCRKHECSEYSTVVWIIHSWQTIQKPPRGGSNILTIPDFVYSPTDFLKNEKPNFI